MQVTTVETFESEKFKLEIRRTVCGPEGDFTFDAVWIYGRDCGEMETRIECC